LREHDKPPLIAALRGCSWNCVRTRGQWIRVRRCLGNIPEKQSVGEAIQATPLSVSARQAVEVILHTEQVGILAIERDYLTCYRRKILKALLRWGDNEDLIIVSAPDLGGESRPQEQFECPELSPDCLDCVRSEVDLEEAGLDPPACIMELKVTVWQEWQPATRVVIEYAQVASTKLAFGDPRPKSNLAVTYERQYVCPDCGNGQVMFDEELTGPVQTPTMATLFRGGRL
jgi:hypothetical protein